MTTIDTTSPLLARLDERTAAMLEKINQHNGLLKEVQGDLQAVRADFSAYKASVNSAIQLLGTEIREARDIAENAKSTAKKAHERVDLVEDKMRERALTETIIWRTLAGVWTVVIVVWPFVKFVAQQFGINLP